MFGSVFAKHAVPNQAAPFWGADFLYFPNTCTGSINTLSESAKIRKLSNSESAFLYVIPHNL